MTNSCVSRMTSTGLCVVLVMLAACGDDPAATSSDASALMDMPSIADMRARAMMSGGLDSGAPVVDQGKQPVDMPVIAVDMMREQGVPGI